jgi:hypothetical protein
MRRLVMLATVIGMLSGCGSSQPAPTPAPQPVPPTVTVASISVTGTAPVVGAAAQFSSTATLSNGTTQNVTSQSRWTSSNISVATVDSTGVVMGVGAGEADVTATYQSLAGTSHVGIIRPAPSTFSIGGLVTDGTSGGVLPNIYVQATDSAGKTDATRTGLGGMYSIGGLTQGTALITASAVSYDTATRTVVIAADTRFDFVLARTPPPAPACTYSVTSGAISRMGFTNSSPFVQTSLASCTWTATSDDAWLLIVDAGMVVPSVTKTGSAAVQVGANPNLHQSRTGTIRISFAGGQIAGQVTQPGFGFP